MSVTVAVTGASGWVGHATCHALKQRGTTVRELVRKQTDATQGHFDLCDPAWESNWAAVLQGCSAIIHCAAHVHRAVEIVADEKMFREVNLVGTDRMLTVAARLGIRRFIFVSTMAVYDWSRPTAPRGESDPTAPTTAYGRSKLEAEQLVRGWTGDGMIARLATVFGEGDRANFARLAAALRRGRFVLPGDGRARKSVLPVTAAAEILAELAIRDDITSTILNVAAPAAPTLAEICATFCRVCNFARPARMPLPLMRGIGWTGDAIGSIAGGFPFTTETLTKLTTTTVVDCARLQSVFPQRRWDSFEVSLRGFADYYARL